MKKLFLIFFIISPCLLFGQNTIEKFESFKYLFVSASSGLRGRAEPNLNSKVLKTEPYGELINAYGRTTDKDTIDGITDYWYYDSTESSTRIWYFGGYLTEYFEKDVFIGRWVEGSHRERTRDVRVYIFLLNNEVRFRNIGLAKGGTYERKGNDLTLNFSICYYGPWDTKEDIKETRKAKIKIIDTNTMQLIFDDGETANLKRNNNNMY